MASLPVVDFSAYSLDLKEPDPERFQKLIDELYDAFTTIGFAYIKNYNGILDEKVKKIFEVSETFFNMDEEIKLKCELPKKYIHGYVCVGRESASQTEAMKRPHTDLREGFIFFPPATKKTWPEDLPEFQDALLDFLASGKILLHRVLEVMARGLNCEDPLFFVKQHEKVGTEKSNTCLRLNHYPPTADVDIKEHQSRCGEHSDYGSVTLLFQKDQAGLEVLNRKGQWISAPPIEGTIVLNIGDAMQRWTSDKYLSSKHRVVNPVKESDKCAGRHTIIYFGAPDDGTILECIDGSNKYQPIEISEYYHEQFNKIQSY